MSSPISVQELGSIVHSSDKYIKVDIYLPEIDGHTVIMTQEIHIINDLHAKMLVDIDILVTEDITMNLPKQTAIIGSCANIKVFLTIMIKSISQIHHTIVAKECIVIPPQSNLAVAVMKLNLPHGQNFLFKPDCHQADASVYAYIVDHTMTEVHV